MRNLKKILALVLALVMSMSLMATANAFTDDASIDADYEAAAKVLADMGIFQGYPDGSFGPTKAITRQEVAAIMYRIASTDVKDTQKGLYVEGANFTDVKATDWSAGYIGFCANGGIVKGNGDGTFGPASQVTGYQVLAMALRAVGYDKNGEFTGAEWQKNVATTAQALGILKNVPGTVQLSQPATRELVAELIFRTLLTQMVEYTPAFGYQPVKIWTAGATNTLGWTQFKLTATPTADDFGRPGTKYEYNVGKKATTILDKAVYTNTVKVSECDIAHALGLTKAAAIEAAYIDGDAQTLTDAVVTTNRYATINPLATTSYVGAQGRVLEVYNMGTAGYRLVEINTYLAKVAKVTPVFTDKNGHIVAATIDINVWAGDADTNAVDYTFTGIKAEGYKVNDYVLVTIANIDGYNATATLNKAIVKSVVTAPIVTGGLLTGWTNAYADVAATTTVGTATYKDADKFELNYRTAGNWSVITDTYGNVIGLTAVATNYLVIEKIEWQHNAGSFGGYALADIVLADGTKVPGVTVSTINTKAANNFGDETPANTTNARVSDNVANNGVYYNHIWTYSVNENGSYNLSQITHNTTANDTLVLDMNDTATYTKSAATISNATNSVVATDNTVFLYKNKTGDTYAYEVYVGKNNAPSVTAADICVKYGTTGYATLVVVSDYALATNSFLAYVTSNTSIGSDANGVAYNVYKIGTTEATIVYDATGLTTVPAGAQKWGWTINAHGHTHGSGLYSITVNTKNQITAMAPVMCDTCCAYSWVGTIDSQKLDRVEVKAAVSGNSFQTKNYGTTGTAANKDFNVTEADTKVIKVYKNGLTASLADGALSDITAGSKVIVKYTSVGTIYSAAVVYVMVDGTPDINNPVAPIDYAASIKAQLENMTVPAGSSEAAVKAAVTSTVGGSYGEWSYTISSVSFSGIVSEGQPLTVTVTGKVGTTVVTVEGIVRVGP